MRFYCIAGHPLGEQFIAYCTLTLMKENSESSTSQSTMPTPLPLCAQCSHTMIHSFVTIALLSVAFETDNVISETDLIESPNNDVIEEPQLGGFGPVCMCSH